MLCPVTPTYLAQPNRDACSTETRAVTSGTFGPTVRKNIALAYVRPDLAATGSVLGVRIRGKDVPATVVRTPWYKRAG